MCLALRSHFDSFIVRFCKQNKSCFCWPLGHQYTRNGPNFFLILIFKTLANGHVFIASQKKAPYNPMEVQMPCVFGAAGQDGGEGVCDSGPRAICHTYASRITGDRTRTHNKPWSCVSVFPKAWWSPQHPTPLKHANVPVLCSNWSQWCSPLLHLCSWEASSQSSSQTPATVRERTVLILCKQTLLCCLALLAPTRHCGGKGESK